MRLQPEVAGAEVDTKRGEGVIRGPLRCVGMAARMVAKQTNKERMAA